MRKEQKPSKEWRRLSRGAPGLTRKRPMLVTIASILFALGGWSLVGLTSIMLVTQTLLPNLLRSMSLTFGTDFLQLIVVGYLLGVFSFFEAYGFWNLRPWSWWLYVGYVIFRLGSYFFSPNLPHPLIMLGDIVSLLFLCYLITCRDRFNVKIPKRPF